VLDHISIWVPFNLENQLQTYGMVTTWQSSELPSLSFDDGLQLILHRLSPCIISQRFFHSGWFLSCKQTASVMVFLLSWLSGVVDVADSTVAELACPIILGIEVVVLRRRRAPCHSMCSSACWF
jgi:hypothetical protein